MKVDLLKVHKDCPKDIKNLGNKNEVLWQQLLWLLEKYTDLQECCRYYFGANSLQNILSEPLQYCAYCGRKLSNKDWKFLNDNYTDLFIIQEWVQQGVVCESQKARAILENRK